MGWDRKARGPQTGYFYHSVRTADGVKKVYLGRGSAGQLAAALIDQRRRESRAAGDVRRAEADATAEADRLAEEVYDWANLLAIAWLTATGHHYHRGAWRGRRD